MHTRNIFALVLILASLVAGDALFAWTAPTAIPPASNVAAPVHTGSAAQTKLGLLGAFELMTNRATVGADPTPEANLLLDVNGRVGASEYCDQNGLNCTTTLGGGGGSVSLTGGLGITLSPTTITNTGTISANTTYLQRRVTGTCPTGQAIRVINQDGTVTCQPSTAVCTWAGRTYTSGARCRIGSLSCVTGLAGYTYQTCGSDGSWTVGGTGCTNGSGSLTSC